MEGILCAAVFNAGSLSLVVAVRAQARREETTDRWLRKKPYADA